MLALASGGLAGCVLLSPAAAQSPSAPDPFAAGPRWSHAASTAEPWLPRDVTFAAGGELVVAGNTGGTAGLGLFGAQWEWDGAGGVDPSLAATTLAHSGSVPLQVEAASDDTVFALEEPAAGARRVARRSVFAIDVETWPLTLPRRGPGSARMDLARSAPLLVVAELDVVALRVWLTWIDTELGVVLATRDLPGASLRELAVSDGGERVLVQCDATITLLDAAGATVHQESAPAVPACAALSGDGMHFAYGRFGGVERRAALPGGSYGELADVSGPSNEVPTTLALDSTGAVLAAGWWRFTDGRAVRLVSYDLSGEAAHETLLAAQSNPSASVQNYPSAIALDPAGELVAFGLWGVGDAQPELFLFERADPIALVASDLPGSVFAVDLDPRGGRVAAGHKLGHANELSALGAVVLAGSGQTDLTLSRTLETGQLGSIHLEANGAVLGLCLAGAPADPVEVAGIDGLLQLDAAAALAFVPMQPDGVGRFRLDVTPAAAWSGLSIGVQGLALGPGAELCLSAVRACPPIF